MNLLRSAQSSKVEIGAMALLMGTIGGLSSACSDSTTTYGNVTAGGATANGGTTTSASNGGASVGGSSTPTSSQAGATGGSSTTTSTATGGQNTATGGGSTGGTNAVTGGATSTGGNATGGSTSVGGTTATGGKATGGATTSAGGNSTSGGASTGGTTTSAGGNSTSGGASTGGTASSGSCSNICTSTTQKTKGTFCDSRDNTTYDCVPIGTQTFMAENLNFGTQVSGGLEQTAPTANAGQKYCYKNMASNCVTYGGLYQWANAMGLDAACNSSSCTLTNLVQGICPPGWHVPSSSEFSMLKSYGDANNGDETMAMSFKATTDWATNPSTGLGGPGNDTFGFSAQGGGGRWLVGTSCTSSGTALTADNNFCWGTKYRGMWWEASQSDASTSSMHDISDDQDGFTKMGSQNKAMGYSIRCVQN